MSCLGQKREENSSLGKADLTARAKGIEDLPILTQLLLGHWHLNRGLKPPSAVGQSVKSTLLSHQGQDWSMNILRT